MTRGSQGNSVVDVPVGEVWTRLQTDKTAVLIDVRTRAEWAFVGMPDLNEAGKKVISAEWQTFPDGRVDPQFADRLNSVLERGGVSRDAELFFICRSGSRSTAAATAMAAHGYSRCHNVADGFEGPLDGTRQRGTTAGWKAAGLPWVQN